MSALQRNLRRAALFRRSLSALPSIFVFQNCFLVDGSFDLLHPTWWCQKQPLTNTAACLVGITMSGFPGSELIWSRKRNPCDRKKVRTSFSGFVFAPRIFAMILLRAVLENVSATVPRSYLSWSPLAPRDQKAFCRTPGEVRLKSEGSGEASGMRESQFARDVTRSERREERFLTSASRPFRRSERGRKSVGLLRSK